MTAQEIAERVNRDDGRTLTPERMKKLRALCERANVSVDDVLALVGTPYAEDAVMSKKQTTHKAATKQVVRTTADDSVRDEPVNEPANLDRGTIKLPNGQVVDVLHVPSEPTSEPVAVPEKPDPSFQEYPRLMWHKRTGEEITVQNALDAKTHADEYQDTKVDLSAAAQRVRES